MKKERKTIYAEATLNRLQPTVPQYIKLRHSSVVNL